MMIEILPELFSLAIASASPVQEAVPAVVQDVAPQAGGCHCWANGIDQDTMYAIAELLALLFGVDLWRDWKRRRRGEETGLRSRDAEPR